MTVLPIFMDCHSTTPVDPRVLEAMLPYFTERFGNAASRSHAFGWQAEEAVEQARARVARLVGAEPREVVFTSGATESDNLAIKGVAEAARDRGDHIVTVRTEHKAVLDSCRRLERRGFRVTYLPVGGDGRVDPDDVRRAIDDRTVLVTIMYANNEIGVLHPIAAIGAVCRERGVPLHCDAVQAAGKVPFDLAALDVDLVSLSAHKLYGPKGVGALVVRRGRDRRARLDPIIDGGGHERGLRSGTINVPGVVGFGAAAEVALAERDGEATRLAALRDRLLAGLRERVADLHVNGSMEHRLPGNLNVSFARVDGDSLLLALRDLVAVSSGSACTSATLEPSYVLRAIGLPDELADASLRFGLGRFNTADEVELLLAEIPPRVEKLRAVWREVLGPRAAGA